MKTPHHRERKPPDDPEEIARVEELQRRCASCSCAYAGQTERCPDCND